MLVDDPPATEKEPDLFKGRARTYYGRWTYKFEMGTARGADAVILIHTDRAAGYGWQVVRNSWTGEQAYVKNAPGQHALAFAGWISETVAQELFKIGGTRSRDADEGRGLARLQAGAARLPLRGQRREHDPSVRYGERRREARRQRRAS